MLIVESSRALPSAGQISVGGPNGIRIAAPQSSYDAVEAVPDGRDALVEFARRHRALTGIGLLVASVIGFLAPIALISAFGLPWALYIAPALASLAALSAGVVVLRPSRRTPVGVLPPELERRVLDEAIRAGGTLTTTELAHATGLTLAEADHALGCLARAGYVDVDNDAESGIVLHRFPEIAGRRTPAPGHR